MKSLLTTLFGITTIVLFSSFSSSEACNYAGANLNYVKARTEEAMATSDINKSRFYTYKAIKVIQTSTTRFDDCGCADAEVNIEESLINLKAATKATSINGTKILLQEALEQIEDAIDNLDQHELHDAEFSTEEFELSTETKTMLASTFTVETELHRQIDVTLENYTRSINKVVESVDCSEAYAYAKAVYDRCEKNLLAANLSEGKKYYNLRTKQITKEALSRIGDCGAK